MFRKPLIISVASALILAAAACGGDDDGDAGATAPAGGTPTAAVATTPESVPTLDPTEEAFAAQLSGLAGFVLTQEEVPAGFTLRATQPVTRREAAVANIGITPVGTFLDTADLQGAWVSFFVRSQPETSFSSRVYAFETPESARRYVEIIAALTNADYPAATSVERVQAADIGDIAQMMRYRVPGSRSLEYTWAQGRFVGQIVLRYAGDIESTEDVAVIVERARVQEARIASGLSE